MFRGAGSVELLCISLLVSAAGAAGRWSSPQQPRPCHIFFTPEPLSYAVDPSGELYRRIAGRLGGEGLSGVFLGAWRKRLQCAWQERRTD